MFFFFSSRRRHTRCSRDWSSDVCSSDLGEIVSLELPKEEREKKARQIASQRKTGESSAANLRIGQLPADRKSTRLNSSHGYISYAVFCLKKKNKTWTMPIITRTTCCDNM